MQSQTCDKFERGISISEKFSFYFRKIYEKCIEYIKKILHADQGDKTTCSIFLEKKLRLKSASALKMRALSHVCNHDVVDSAKKLTDHMGPVKRICVFEHSVMTKFNCACPAIQRGQGSGFLSEGSSWLAACMSEQRRFWRDCADAQARLNLRCSHRL